MQQLLIEAARAQYDIVLIDAPPLLPVTDAAILAGATDGAIMVVHHGATTREQLRAATARLDSVEARLVGTIVNMAPAPKRGRSCYGYGYGYGYAPTQTTHSKPSKKEASANAVAKRPRSKT